MGETDDVVALWRLQSRYADVVTRRAWHELHEIFLPETTVDIDVVTAPPRSFQGPDGFGDFVARAVERFDHFTFAILNTVVDLDGPERARGRMFMCEIRQDREDRSWSTAYGMYNDRYVRVDGRWWFAERRYRSMARTGPNEAVLGLPPSLTD